MADNKVDLCFVYFRSLTLDHLDAAWYSVSRQDFSQIARVIVLDNNTDDSAEAIEAVLDRYPIPVQRRFISDKHGDPTRTQSWSVNEVCRRAEGWIFFTRADYILAFDAVARMVATMDTCVKSHVRAFISGWCWQMSYDRGAVTTPEVDIEQLGWRERGMPALLDHPYGFKFHETDQDAGVWLTHRNWMEMAGWMNEGMVSWGYQQSTFQRALKQRACVQCYAVQDYLFAHQHHEVVRDFTKARAEYDAHGGGV